MTREEAMDFLLDGLTDEEFREIQAQHTATSQEKRISRCREELRTTGLLSPGTRWFDATEAAQELANEEGREIRWTFNDRPIVTVPTATSQGWKPLDPIPEAVADALAELRKPKDMTYKIEFSGNAPHERYCHHCEADTQHECRDSNHERDGSGDWRECLRCGWHYSGLTGRYHPPTATSQAQPPTAGPTATSQGSIQ